MNDGTIFLEAVKFFFKCMIKLVPSIRMFPLELYN